MGNLASATYNQTETIYKVPDAVGNLYRTPDRKGYTYSEGGRLLECPDWKYVYDLEGQLIEKISKKQQLKRFSLIVEEDEKPATLRWFYSWNANGSLKSVANNDRVHFAFEYDALGRRTAKINLSSKRIKRFLWDGNVPLHEWEYDLSERPNLSRDKDNLLVYDKEEPVTDNLITWVFDENSFVPAVKLVGDKSYSILTDHLGTPYEAYDEEGKKVWARELDLYGNAIAGDSSFIPFLYQGQYYDEEIGLAYNRFRYYSPESGTYISQDPIRLAGGLAFYGYVMDCNGWIDPWGLSSAALRRNLEASYGDNKQAQHLIPEEVWNDTDNTKFFNDIGLGDGRDKKENGLMIWDNEKMATANNKKYYHGGSHADYSLQVGFEVRDINLRYNIHGDKDLARKEISELQNRLRTELDADLDDINTKAKRLH